MRRFCWVWLLWGCKDGSEVTQGKPDLESDSDSVGDLPFDSGDSEPPPVDNDADGYDSGSDCDDNNAAIHPDAVELCNGLDDNCDGVGDLDTDGDGLRECEDFCPIYTLWGASGDGRSIDPVGTIQEGIDLAGASGCNEVRASGGTYYENIDFHGYPVNLESLSGPAYTVINGQAAGSVVSFQTSEGPDSRIYGFTLTNGAADGGGIKVYTTSPTIEGNIITGNVAQGNYNVGGGIWSFNGSPTIVDNEISENDACWGGPEDGCDGGGIDARGGEPFISGNQIVDNIAGDGGGIWLAHSDAIIVNNLIAGNLADDTAYEDTGERDRDGQGGGIDVQLGGPAGPTIVGNIIQDNSASAIGGGLVIYEDKDGYNDGIVANNTIIYNRIIDTDYGAGIAQFRRTDPIIYNNIVAWNEGPGVWSEDEIDTLFTYNLVYGNSPDYGGLMDGGGTGNFSADPAFTMVSPDGDWSNDDLHLKAGSPGINKGDPTVLDVVDGSRSDVGAYGGTEGAGW